MINESVSQAISILHRGGLIVFPTDTVWGIGASLHRLDAIDRLYQLKKRDVNQPTAVLVGNIVVANRLGVINDQAQALLNKFWPGPLTIIVKAKGGLPGKILGKNKTIGLRQPSHKLLLDLLNNLDTGLVASSANFKGQKTPAAREEIDQFFLKQVDFILPGKCHQGLASTVVDTTVKPAKIIRQGVIPLDKGL